MIGSIVLATEQGLGYLAKDFYDNGVLDLVYIQPHSSRKSHPEWFPNRVNSVDELLEKCTTLLFFETPFDWKVITRARNKGIKTVLMPMYECTRWPLPYEPDLIIAPSLLDYDHYKDKNCEFIPVPVDETWRLRTNAEVFVHNAGNGGLGGRNGTRELLEAMQYVKSRIKLIVRSQVPIKGITDPRVFIEGPVEKEDLWKTGDVFVFPEKFNGLSLPMQEAYASGMFVMGGNRYPINTWLPEETLIPVREYKKENIAGLSFDSAVYDPKEIARCIDEWYGKDITQYSLDGRDWAKTKSWKALKDRYLTILK